MLTQHSTSPISLIPALTSLTNPKNEDMPAAAREYLMRYLVLAPMRPTHGVRATLEFVFAVHPSSSMRRPPNSTAEKNADGTAKPDKRGAPITQEALKMATRLLAMAPPERMGVTADEWYNAVGEQLLILLDGADGEELVRVAAYVVGFGVLGNKKSGMPGTF